MNRKASYGLRAIGDGVLTELDRALRTLSGSELPVGPMPSPSEQEQPAAGYNSPTSLTPSERALATALMRVNHAGEVAAQALYRGQALTTVDPEVREALLDAAREEEAHLGWCRQRVTELGGRTSVLGPAWYAGSFALGATAGLLGRSAGLGFVLETERQVEAHLSDHLSRLPSGDTASRTVVHQMRNDEAAHGARARALGAAELPKPVRQAMRLMAGFMTTVAHRV
ncbi:MAG: 2-polyprenyl-3-methyl-6-methoxy-1,4-benzoquinone monooxygenase [Gammaproteobacteria bacterium]